MRATAASSRKVRLIWDCDMEPACHAENPLSRQKSHDMVALALSTVIGQASNLA